MSALVPVPRACGSTLSRPSFVLLGGRTAHVRLSVPDVSATAGNIYERRPRGEARGGMDGSEALAGEERDKSKSISNSALGSSWGAHPPRIAILRRVSDDEKQAHGQRSSHSVVALIDLP